MPCYRYTQLSTEAQDIRLLKLLPGRFEEPVRLSLFHTPFVPPNEPLQQRLSTNVLDDTLPPGWRVFETLEGRYVFNREETGETSWSHPDPSFGTAPYSDPIKEDVNKGFQPKYEALSYTWGSMKELQTAYIDTSVGHSSPGDLFATISISQNLDLALRHLRYPERCRTLWVDAVCINQTDVSERCEQVKRMGDIYKFAWRVLVWLGPEANESGVAISLLRHLGMQSEETVQGLRIRSPDCTEPNWFQTWLRLPYSTSDWCAIRDLAFRPWFERQWVFQEIQLSNNQAVLQCGYDEISWPLLRRAVICLRDKQGIPLWDLRQRLDLLFSSAQDRRQTSLRRLFETTWELKCSDPRDKVYGIMGLAPPAILREIYPDYSLSTEAVYKDAFLVQLSHVHRLELLPYCHLRERRIKGPSWVPDFSAQRSMRILVQFASGFSCSEATYISPGTLEVTGVSCATVQHVSRPLLDLGNSRTILEVIRTWEQLNMQQDCRIGTGESLIDAFVSTLRLNLLKERFPSFSIPTLQEWRQTFMAKYSCSSDTHADSFPDIDEDFYWCRGRTFVTSVEGYIGLCPIGASPGTLIPGCHTEVTLPLIT